MKCCEVTAGMLRTPVEFQRKTREPDGAGGWLDTWGTIPGAAQLAWEKSLSGSERLLASRLDATTTGRIVVRYFAGLTGNDRVLIEGRPHNIKFVNDVERRKRWLEIDVAGGVAT
jgi:SPP1 family predicted phage head-tail adaptor